MDTHHTMKTHHNRAIVVAGGTGNVGGFIVRALLEQGATVAVPSRSAEKIRDMTKYLKEHVETDLRRLHTFVGTVSDETDGPEVARQITRELGAPCGVIALMGSWRQADSLLDVSLNDLDHVLEHYLKAHFGVVRAFLPILNEHDGTYVFVNGPLAFDVWPNSGLVSIATAAQHMLFQVLVKEHENSPVRVAELVSHAFIRNRQTQPGSPIPGEAVGAFAVHLALDQPADTHGKSLHLRSLAQLEAAGLDTAPYKGDTRAHKAGETEAERDKGRASKSQLTS